MFRYFGVGIPVPNPTIYERSEMYILDVKTPNKLLTHRGRTVRTPAKFPVTESELKTLKVMLRQVGAEEFTIRSKEEVDREIQERKELEAIEVPEVHQEVIIEELMDNEEETRSVLDKLIRDAEKE